MNEENKPHLLNVQSIWQPFGPFSHVALQGAGQIVHLKGQIPLDRNGNLVGDGDIKVQVRQVLENIQKVLESMNGRMTDVLSLSQYTTDLEAFLSASPIRGEFFCDPFPVTTTVAVAALYRPDVMVEISAIAEIPKSRFKPPSD